MKFKNLKIRNGNSAFKKKEYEEAISSYILALIQTPKLAKIITTNIIIAKSKKRRAKAFLNTNKSLRVGICSNSLESNDTRRIYELAQFYKKFAKPEIIETIILNQSEQQVTAHFKKQGFPVYNLLFDNINSFIDRCLELVSYHPYDLIHLCNPSLSNIIIGALYEFFWDARIRIDIDKELDCVNTQFSLKLAQHLDQKSCLFILNKFTVTLVENFCNITVSSSTLHQKYGGDIVSFLVDAEKVYSASDSHGDYYQKLLQTMQAHEEPSLLLAVAKLFEQLRVSSPSVIQYLLNFSYLDRVKTFKNANTQVNFSDTQKSKLNTHILLVSYYCPTRAHAGGLRILDIYTLIRQKFPNIQLDIFTYHRPSIDWSLDEVNKLFDHVYLSPSENLTPEVLSTLRCSQLRYDIIDMQFHDSGYQIDKFRSIGAKILFTPMESMLKVVQINWRKQFLALDHLDVMENLSLLKPAIDEMKFVSKADEVVCVSQGDAALLSAVTASKNVRWLDTGLSQIEFANALLPSFSGKVAKKRRCNILYIAYFGSETNIEALRWYLEHVHNFIKAKIPNYVFTVVGRGDLSEFVNYKDSSVEFVGEVNVIAPYIQEAGVGIAPALSGAGFRGKINQYAIYSVPCVASPLAHKGLQYRDGENIFLAEKPKVFAAHCIKLLSNLELNDRVGQAARSLCRTKYTWISKWPAICKLYNLVPSSNLNKVSPKITVLVPSYNHGQYIQKRIESIVNQTYKNIELIVIDDHSSDESHEIILGLQERYRFQYLLNNENSGTPFSSWEHVCSLAAIGDYIWICESDDIAEPTFLEKAIVNFLSEPNAVLFYTHSHIIDEKDNIIGNTSSYFSDVWKDKGRRWDNDFIVDGEEELRQFQLYGQTVPNMSSALIKSSAFKDSFIPFLKKLHLTGDWLFIGNIMKKGRVIFNHATLNRFRKHEVTSRVRVNVIRSQAEFILTKYHMFSNLDIPPHEFFQVMKNDINRFFFENTNWQDLINTLAQISLEDTVRFFELLFLSLEKNIDITDKFVIDSQSLKWTLNKHE